MTAATGFAARIRTVVPPPGLTRSLAVQSFVYATGAGTFMAGSAVFFTRVLGLAPTQIGLGLGLAAAVSLVSSVPLGLVIDRIGAKRAWIAGSLAEAALFALYPFVPGLAGFLIMVTALATVQSVSGVALQVYSIGALPEGERVRGMAYQRSALNVGLTVGGGIAGAAMALDTLWAYQLMVFVNAALLALATVFVARLPDLDPAVRTPAPRRRLAVIGEPSVLATSGLAGFLQANQTILLVILPLWVMGRTDAPMPLVAALFVANTVLTVLLQVRASAGAETAGGAAGVLRQSGLLVAASCLVFAAAAYTGGAATVGVLVLGIVVLTAGELRQSAGAWGVTAALSPADRRGEYVGTFRVGAQLQRMVAPAAFTALALDGGAWGWLVIAAIFVVAGWAIGPAVRWVESRQARDQVRDEVLA